MNNFCCNKMYYYILQESKKNDPSIEYDSCMRSYSLRIINSNYGTHDYIKYCPWCGTKLPKILGDEWENMLKENYNISDPYFDENSKIPEEFKTDEWWKKLGL